MAAGSVAWGDYDNDGDRDLAVVGPDGAAVYRNEGGGVFIEAVGLTVGSSFYYDGYSATEVASGSSVAWGD